MQVRAGGASRVAHQSDRLTFSDLFAHGDQVFFIVRVAGRIAIAVVNLDEIAKPVAIRRPGDDAIRDRDDFRACFASEINALVIGRFSSKGNRASPEVGGHVAG